MAKKKTHHQTMEDAMDYVKDTFSEDDMKYYGAMCLLRLLRDPYLYDRYIKHPNAQRTTATEKTEDGKKGEDNDAMGD